MKKNMQRVIGGIWTVVGFLMVVLGFWNFSKDTMIIGFLAMILGELVDLDIRFKFPLK